MIDLDPIFDLLDAMESLNEDAIWVHVVSSEEIKELIIEMNTNDQLYELGIDSKGKTLGEYAPMTIAYKRSVGERSDHVTLKDTGEFYRSWRVDVDVNGITIDADDVKSPQTALFEIYGEDVLGLTDQNLDYLVEAIRDKYLEYIYARLLG